LLLFGLGLKIWWRYKRYRRRKFHRAARIIQRWASRDNGGDDDERVGDGARKDDEDKSKKDPIPMIMLPRASPPPSLM
jgi:hypothetical protein